MFGLFRKNDESIYDEPIEKLLIEMNMYGSETEEYAAAIRHFETLMKLKTETRRKPITSDTIAIVAGNLVGILVIVAYEQKHVMASKAMGFALKPKSPHV